MRMRRRESVRDIEDIGDFAWKVDGDRRSLVVRTPSRYADSNPGRYEQTSWPIRPHATQNGHSWEWDGNEDEPTLTPSLHHILHHPNGDVTLWHGWVRAGELVEA